MKRRTEFAVAFIGEDLICHLAKALARARSLHPDFAASASGAVDAVLDEATELWLAAGTESHDRQNEEATDVIVTGIRFLNGEYTEEGRRGIEHVFVHDDLLVGAHITAAWIDESSLLPESEKLGPGRIVVHQEPDRPYQARFPSHVQMNEPKRYDPVVAEDCDPPFGMVPAMRNNTGGRFVHYMDYTALLAHHNALVEAVKKYLDCSDICGNFEGVDGELRRSTMKVWSELRAEVDRLIGGE